MRVVLDTNCLIQCISIRSRFHAVWLSFVNGQNTLCVSNEIIDEYAEVLQRLTDYETAEIIIKTIVNSPFVEFVTPYYHFGLIPQDPDDNKFVDCAVSATARYIVTNDHHYDILKEVPFPKVDIISIVEFMNELK
ncbi:MAG: putative toxin-antitoxin system toxin component, PIN family [Paludibacteraceae bacterium]|nr:putative toxin-antitoxin system toxin component, PIN family [Paludibacteraceae bacterium]